VLPHRSKAKVHLSTSPFPPPVESTAETYEVGDRVSHDAYGLGRVVSVEGATAVVVDFGPSRRRFVTPYTALTKL
jgi:hypothetical protein